MITKVFYRDEERSIYIGRIITNHSMTIDEALELINFDEEEFMERFRLDGIDYGNFELRSFDSRLIDVIYNTLTKL